MNTTPDVMTGRDFRLLMRTAKGLHRDRTAFRAAVLFLWASGARPGEMRALKWEHIDLAAGAAVMPRAKDSPRIIPLSPAVQRLLRCMRRSCGRDADFVFVNAWNRPWTAVSFSCRFQRVAAKAGLKIRAYSLRYGFIMRAMQAGVPMSRLARQLGLKLPNDGLIG